MDNDGTDIGCTLTAGPALGSATRGCVGFPVRVHNYNPAQYHKDSSLLNILYYCIDTDRYVNKNIQHHWSLNLLDHLIHDPIFKGTNSTEFWQDSLTIISSSTGKLLVVSNIPGGTLPLKLLWASEEAFAKSSCSSEQQHQPISLLQKLQICGHVHSMSIHTCMQTRLQSQRKTFSGRFSPAVRNWLLLLAREIIDRFLSKSKEGLLTQYQYSVSLRPYYKWHNTFGNYFNWSLICMLVTSQMQNHDNKTS